MKELYSIVLLIAKFRQTMSDDLIRREDAIDAIERTGWYHINARGELVHGANSQEDVPLYKAEDIYKAIDGVPTAGKIGEINVDVQRLAEIASKHNVKNDFEVKEDGGCEVWIEPMKGESNELI